MRPTVMEVSLNNLKYNIDSIKKYIGNKMMIPIIKANGYGTYINKRLDILNMFDIVGVALVSEAIELRNIGYTKDIIVINQPCIDEIDDIIKYNITVGVSSTPFIEELINRNSNISIHIEVDSGMGRTGITLDEIDKFKNLLYKSNLKVEGIYTHLSSADSDDNYTLKQFDIFNKALKRFNYNFKYIHACASNGLINYKDNIFNTVRPGIILYGYESFKGILDKINLKPICKLKSKVTFLKTVDKETSISYGRKYITDKVSKIATIPIGYADGMDRNLFNKAYVVINKHKYSIIGTICMDSIMVLVDDNVKLNDDVYIWDNDIIKVEEIADSLNTINYEVISRISDRVPRIFID